MRCDRFTCWKTALPWPLSGAYARPTSAMGRCSGPGFVDNFDIVSKPGRRNDEKSLEELSGDEMSEQKVAAMISPKTKRADGPLFVFLTVNKCGKIYAAARQKRHPPFLIVLNSRYETSKEARK